MTAARRPRATCLTALLALAAGCGLLAAPALAEQRIGLAMAFVDLTRANDCTLTEAEGVELLPAAGLSMDDARDAAALLNQGALFQVSDDALTLILSPELCDADAAGTRDLLEQAAAAGPNLTFLSLSERVDPGLGAQLVGLIRANGCTMTGTQAEARLPALGFTPETVQDIVALLILTGQAGYDGESLWLDARPCTGSDVPDLLYMRGLIAELAIADGLIDPPADPPAVVEALVAEIRAQGCALATDEPAVAIPALSAAVRARLADPDAEPAAVAAVIDLALGDSDARFIHEAGRLRLADCSS